MSSSADSPSRVLRIPPRGRALIVSDLHGNLPDWQAFLQKSRAIERIAAGEDLWVILTGDVPDVTRHRSVDPRVPEDGDVQILDALLAAKASLGPRGERIVYAEGNHDFHVGRVNREAARYEAERLGTPAPDPREHPVVDAPAYERFVEHYRKTYGPSVLANNIAPYDMVPRARVEHVRLITSGPILVVLEGPGVAIVHAGPMKGVAGLNSDALLAEIEAATPSQLINVSPELYFASAYHQLLNNRFRHGDYSLDDVKDFAALFGCRTLVSGHTPHPYLLDLGRGVPLPECSFTAGLGLIGDHQLVLCTSFGAFSPSSKRYLELDLTRSYPDARALASDPDAVCRLYEPEEALALEAECRPLPGADLVASGSL
ncbi:MAG: metallophosphoesterase [Planctomycetes bacterium]|nr:metallophosphoesterase [Planctomycetota bacterium]